MILLQIYVVQDNVEIYNEDQYDELQKRNYTDVDGPAYRFCTEYSVKHKGDSFKRSINVKSI